MRRLFFTVLVLVLAFGLIPAAVAQTGGSGTSVGIIVGEPTGLSAKQWVGGGVGFDAALAWSFRDPGSIYAHVDYQQHFESTLVDEGLLLFYFGLGGKVYLSTELVVGARVPLGVFYDFDGVPIEVFFELAPGLNLVPAPEPDAGGGIGVRYQL